MAVDAIDDVQDFYPILPLDPIEKPQPQITIESGMVEFAEAMSLLSSFNTFKPEESVRAIIAKLDEAIQKDPNKCAYYILRGVFNQALDFNEAALADMTLAINIAETRGTEWLLGTEELAEEFEALQTAASGNTQYDTLFEIELERGELYFMRYDIYWDLDREDEPQAIADLKMAARLGDEDAIDELDWRGISL